MAVPKKIVTAPAAPPTREQLIALELDKQKKLRRMIAAVQSRDSLLGFTRFTMPDPEDVDDTQKSLFDVNWHHEAICELLQKMERGEILRAIITMPPRHGKSEICSRRFPAWFMGRDPYRQMIFATYGADFAEDFGRKAREIIETPAYRQVFPRVSLKAKSKAADRMETEAGGMMVWIGVGGPATGRGADLLLIDDPFKNREEAESLTHRNKVWDWFTSVAYTRLMPNGRIVIICCMTGDTPVLLADGTEKRLDALRVGDAVATYENGRLSVSTVANWKRNGLDLVYKIKTSSGRVVRANGRHPFLVSDGGELKWIRTRNLSTANEIVTVKDDGGSGKGRRASQMAATSQPSVEGAACRITSRKNGLMAPVRHPSTRSPSEHDTSSIATASPLRNTLATLLLKAANALYALPRLLTAIASGSVSIIATRRVAFVGCSATPATLPPDTSVPSKSQLHWQNISEFTTDQVVSVEPDGEEEVFDVQIARTENFIANGLVSHNTRWHENDVAGRIFDPDFIPPRESKKWYRLDLPAIIEENTESQRALWPQRYPLDVLESTRDFIGERDWNALYQQRPTPPEGAFFRQEMIFTYGADEMPRNFRPYMTGDLALGEKKTNDETCVGKWMLDETDTLYLHPDLYWDRKSADASVERIIDMMKEFAPMATWWEKGQIDRAVGPFFRKRLMEREVYSWLTALPVKNDKAFRAASIRGRMALGKVRFPKFAPWWPRAKEQLLKFTGNDGDADDFVDMASLIGQALGGQIKANKPSDPPKNVVPITGSMAWVRYDSDFRKREQKRLEARKGF